MATKNETLEEIAKKMLRVDTLETRDSDSLDFYQIGIASIRDALEAAYEAGRKSVKGKK